MSKKVEYGTKDYSLGWQSVDDFFHNNNAIINGDVGYLYNTLSALRLQIEYLTLKVAHLEKKAQVYEETKE